MPPAASAVFTCRTPAEVYTLAALQNLEITTGCIRITPQFGAVPGRTAGCFLGYRTSSLPPTVEEKLSVCFVISFLPLDFRSG